MQPSTLCSSRMGVSRSTYAPYPSAVGSGASRSAAAAAQQQQRQWRARRSVSVCAGGGGPAKRVDKGFSLLEWTSALVPQGALVTGAKTGWRLGWQTMVRELAPQDSGGAYTRPQYSFGGVLGSAEFPVRS
jgi:hypothetical protein